jgi:uncharacterized membrane protein YhhN
MKNIYGVLIFLLVLIIHIAGIYIGNEMIEKITKPLLIAVLAGYFILSVRSFRSGLKKWIILALLFSWVGDILLMFVADNSAFFLAGLSTFLIAHLFYIFFFHAVRIQENIKGKAFLLLLVFIYYAILMTVLTPGLGSMKLPVGIYGVFICFMVMLAMHMLYVKNRNAGTKMFAGALLFVISDTVLAINKFYYPFMEAGIIVMITYGVAQLLIVQGAIEYIKGIKSK